MPPAFSAATAAEPLPPFGWGSGGFRVLGLWGLLGLYGLQ